MNKCYICNNNSTSDEHVPPKCLFPKDKRNQLITVPSCDIHNSEKSGYDEFLRNVLTNHHKTNSFGLELSLNKSRKSITINRNNFKNILKKYRPTTINGQQTIEFAVNKKNYATCFSNICYGLYWHDHKKTFTGRWMINFEDDQYNVDDNMISVGDIIKGNFLNFIEQKVWNPNIFKYFKYTENDLLIYWMVFYDGINIFGVTFNVGNGT